MQHMDIQIGGDLGQGVEYFVVRVGYKGGVEMFHLDRLVTMEGEPVAPRVSEWYFENKALVDTLCRGVVAAQIELDKHRARMLGVEAGGITANIAPEVTTRGESRSLNESALVF
jgi:hypothetical protein